jgi:iron complex transport system permease protein
MPVPVLRKTVLVSLGLFGALVAVVFLSLAIGTSGADVRKLFLEGPAPLEAKRAWTILVEYRLPRTLLAAAAGAGLASAGVIFQGVLRNPLADPYLVGIAAGGALGAVISIVSFGGGRLYGTCLSAFIGSLAAVGIVFGLASAKRGARDYVHTVILAGVIVAALMNALMLLIISVSGSDEMQRILFWLMGDLSLADYRKVLFASGGVLFGWTVAYLNANRLNLLIAGDETALHLGLEVSRTRGLLMAAAAMMTGVVVSVCGTIGFVGLVVPHAMRLMFGPDSRVLLPASLIGGAAFLSAADTAARVVAYPVELPVGVITALAGAPFFLYLLLRR